MVNDITLVVGIDAKTIEQLKISWPTWKKNRPEMWDWHWIVFYDDAQLLPYPIAKLEDELALPRAKWIPWPPHGTNQCYDSQRERMLTGHVFVPAMHCQTTWHMKLDTDALAKPHEGWLDPQWFELSGKGQPPAYIAPRWHYTKGVGYLDACERWGDAALPGQPRLNIPQKPDQLRVGHARMCSWCSFYLTEFTQQLAAKCQATLGTFKLPCPSQDTTAWYFAERGEWFYRIVGMKKRGWSNHSRTEELRRVAAEIMSA